jgi:hypothetical protein
MHKNSVPERFTPKSRTVLLPSTSVFPDTCSPDAGPPLLLLDVVLEALALLDVLVVPLEALAVPPVPLPPVAVPVPVPLLDEPAAPKPPVPVLVAPEPPQADTITVGKTAKRAMWVARTETSKTQREVCTRSGPRQRRRAHKKSAVTAANEWRSRRPRENCSGGCRQSTAWVLSPDGASLRAHDLGTYAPTGTTATCPASVGGTLQR